MENKGLKDYWRGYRQARIDYLMLAIGAFESVLEENSNRPKSYYDGMVAYHESQKVILKELLRKERKHG